MITYIFGFIILTIPALYGFKIMIREKVKRKKKLLLKLEYDRLVRQEKLSIESMEQFNGKLVGLDRKNKKLLFIDHAGPNKHHQCIQLLEIASCRVLQVEDQFQKGISKIYLELKHKRNNGISRFCFYDDSRDLLTDLSTLAGKATFWKNKIDVHKYRGNASFELGYVL
jgi:hypothetical protein